MSKGLPPHRVNVNVIFEVDFSLQVTKRHELFLKPTQLLVELLEVTKLQKISSPSLSFFEHVQKNPPFEALQPKKT